MPPRHWGNGESGDTYTNVIEPIEESDPKASVIKPHPEESKSDPNSLLGGRQLGDSDLLGLGVPGLFIPEYLDPNYIPAQYQSGEQRNWNITNTKFHPIGKGLEDPCDMLATHKLPNGYKTNPDMPYANQHLKDAWQRVKTDRMLLSWLRQWTPEMTEEFQKNIEYFSSHIGTNEGKDDIIKYALEALTEKHGVWFDSANMNFSDDMYDANRGKKPSKIADMLYTLFANAKKEDTDSFITQLTEYIRQRTDSDEDDFRTTWMDADNYLLFKRSPGDYSTGCSDDHGATELYDAMKENMTRTRNILPALERDVYPANRNKKKKITNTPVKDPSQSAASSESIPTRKETGTDPCDPKNRYYPGKRPSIYELEQFNSALWQSQNSANPYFDDLMFWYQMWIDYRQTRNRILIKLAKNGINNSIDFLLNRYIPGYSKLIKKIPALQTALNTLLGELEDDLLKIASNDPDMDWGYYLSQRSSYFDRLEDILKLEMQKVYAKFLLAQKGLQDFPCPDDEAEYNDLSNQQLGDADFLLDPFPILRIPKNPPNSNPSYGGGGSGGRWLPIRSFGNGAGSTLIPLQTSSIAFSRT